MPWRSLSDTKVVIHHHVMSHERGLDASHHTIIERISIIESRCPVKTLTSKGRT
jgi:hypothetical protein